MGQLRLMEESMGFYENIEKMSFGRHISISALHQQPLVVATHVRSLSCRRWIVAPGFTGQ